MAPPTATSTETHTNGDNRPSTKAPLEPGLSEAQAKVQMPKFPGPPSFEDKYEEREYLKGRLAAAFRIFGKYGFDEGVAGHITLRDPVDPTTFWVNPFGVAFSLIKKSDLIQVNHAGKIIAGGDVKLLNAAAFMIHGAVHEARPDVMCAAHSHSIYGRSFCSLGRKLDTITQDACSFHNVSQTPPITQKPSIEIGSRTMHSTPLSMVSSSPRKKVKRSHAASAIRKPLSCRIMAF